MKKKPSATDLAYDKMVFALELVESAYYKDDKFDLTFAKLWSSRFDVVREALEQAKIAKPNRQYPIILAD